MSGSLLKPYGVRASLRVALLAPDVGLGGQFRSPMHAEDESREERMQTSESTQKAAPAAIWYLTTGEAVVGPVHTNLLLRGISAGRVPEECYAARANWSGWRELPKIREVAAYYQARDEGLHLPLDHFVVERPEPVTIEDFRGAEDVDDCFKIALRLAVARCSAQAGLVHRSLPPHVGLVTTHAYGRALRDNLGEVIPWYDETRGASLDGGVLLGAPTRDDWARPSARRMASGLVAIDGAAVLPVRCDDGPQALIELGRPEHGFRISDERKLLEIREALLQRVDQLRF